MSLWECIQTRRSIRSFTQAPVAREILLSMLDAARLAPSGANLLPLKYALITDEQTRAQLYPYIHYAGYLPNFNPTPEQCPTAFIAVLADTDIRPAQACECDAGLSMMSMCLVARDRGLDTVILGAIDREVIAKQLSLSENLSPLYLLGVGYAAQHSVTVPFSDSVKYTMDGEGTVSVPKRSLKEILVEDSDGYSENHA